MCFFSSIVGRAPCFFVRSFAGKLQVAGCSSMASMSNALHNLRLLRVASTIEERVASVIPYVDFDHATIVDRAKDYHKRLFLEAWYSGRDSTRSGAGNERIDIQAIQVFRVIRSSIALTFAIVAPAK